MEKYFLIIDLTKKGEKDYRVLALLYFFQKGN